MLDHTNDKRISAKSTDLIKSEQKHCQNTEKINIIRTILFKKKEAIPLLKQPLF